MSDDEAGVEVVVFFVVVSFFSFFSDFVVGAAAGAEVIELAGDVERDSVTNAAAPRRAI